MVRWFCFNIYFLDLIRLKYSNCGLSNKQCLTSRGSDVEDLTLNDSDKEGESFFYCGHFCQNCILLLNFCKGNSSLANHQKRTRGRNSDQLALLARLLPLLLHSTDQSNARQPTERVPLYSSLTFLSHIYQRQVLDNSFPPGWISLHLNLFQSSNAMRKHQATFQSPCNPSTTKNCSTSPG